MNDPRRVTTDNYRDCTIDDFVSDFCWIFEEKDRGRSLLDIWMHAVEHASRLAEEIRRERYDRVQEELAGAFAWIASFVANCGTKQAPGERVLRLRHSLLSDIIWNKYPRWCPVCELPGCVCLVRLEEVEGRNQQEAERLKRERKQRVAAQAQATRGQKVTNIIELEEMFHRIFRRNIFAFPIENIGFHLLEEIGEVCYAITAAYTYVIPDESQPVTRDDWSLRIDDLEGEIADVMSWLFSLSCKLREIFKVFDRYVSAKTRGGPTRVELAPHLYLADSTMQAYSGGGRGDKLKCKHCPGPARCDCRIYMIDTAQKAASLVGTM